jgi:hypothetical protein
MLFASDGADGLTFDAKLMPDTSAIFQQTLRAANDAISNAAANLPAFLCVSKR